MNNFLNQHHDELFFHEFHHNLDQSVEELSEDVRARPECSIWDRKDALVDVEEFFVDVSHQQVEMSRTRWLWSLDERVDEKKVCLEQTLVKDSESLGCDRYLEHKEIYSQIREGGIRTDDKPWSGWLWWLSRRW